MNMLIILKTLMTITMMLKQSTLTKYNTSANTISTELLSTNLLLGINDLLGFYMITLAILPFLIGPLRMIILARVFAVGS